jgi:NAD(P)-dependent dehydrogenase (short-subunit alcohol dehydrogenase family)
MSGAETRADFTGRVVLVTGAASGIGAAVATRFIDAGASVAGCDIAGEPLPGAALWASVDVSDQEQVDAFVARVVAELGRLDVVVNVAGVGIQSDTFVATHQVTLPQWQKVIDVNLTGSFLVAHAALPALIESRGTVVNIASVYGLAAAPGTIAYAASKHGVIGLTKGMALEYAKDGVRVNAICPGFVNTPMVQHHLVQAGDPEAELGRLNELHPMGRIAAPPEIADAVFWVASDSAGFVTGTAIPVDGGFASQG